MGNRWIDEEIDRWVNRWIDEDIDRWGIDG